MGLLDFLIKGDVELLSKIINYTNLVVETVNRFETLIENLNKNNKEMAIKTFYEIDLLETQADDFHRRLVEEIAKGNFFSYLREDFLMLLEKIDGVADAAKDAAKILVESNLEKGSIRFFFSEIEGFKYVKLLKKTVLSLSLSIKAIKKEPPSKLLKMIRDVESYEEDADAVKDDLMKKLYENANKLKLLDVITLKDFLNVADDIADNAEDASDVILQMIAKGYV